MEGKRGRQALGGGEIGRGMGEESIDVTGVASEVGVLLSRL